MAKENPILDLQALKIGYAESLWKDPVSLSLKEGELLVIAGPNGAGKSTLLRTLAGLHSPISGAILMQGKDISRCTTNTLARLRSVVFTADNGVPEITVRNYLETADFSKSGWFGTHREAALNAVMDAFDIQKFESRPLYMLSDGERQKVRIAGACLQETPLIMLDEPSHHLDVANRARLFTRLKKLVQETGVAMVLCTHEVEWGLRIADRLLVVSQAQMRFGTAEEIVSSGILDEVYGTDAVRFNPDTGRFEPATDL